MEGDTHEVDQGATLRREGREGRTHALLRDVGPILDPGPSPDLGPALVPKIIPDPVLGLSLGTGLQLARMMVTLREAGRHLDHLYDRGSRVPLL